MNELLKVAVLAFVEAQTDRQGNGTNGRVPGVVITVAGFALAALIAIGCVLAALWNYLRPALGAEGAYLIVALVAVVSWIVLFLAMRQTGKARAGLSAKDKTLDTIRENAERLFAQNKGVALTAALVAGLIAGAENVHRR